MQLARTAEKQLRADAKGKKTTKHTCAKYGKIQTKKIHTKRLRLARENTKKYLRQERENTRNRR